MIRLATEADLKEVKRITNQNREFVGFVMNVALRESMTRESLLVLELDGQVRGFAHFHRRLDGWTTLHELAIDKRCQRSGHGQQLFQAVPTPMRLKTTVDNVNARAFYVKQGMTEARREAGKQRPLVVFEKGAPAPRVTLGTETEQPKAPRRRRQP